MSQILTEKIPAIRATFIVDDDTYSFLLEAYTHRMDEELWVIDTVEDIEYEVFVPCEDCGSRYQMENYACSNNQGYCLDCCECDEHFPEFALDEHMQLTLEFD